MAQRSSLLSCCAFSLLFASALSASLFAQDRRTVLEPHIPAVCTKLEADLSAPHGLLTDAGEHRLDTERIQKAIDHCGSGEAVELHGSGDRNVFLPPLSIFSPPSPCSSTQTPSSTPRAIHGTTT